MSTLEARCLDVFPNWLRALGEDARALAALLDSPELGDGARRTLVGALNYLFKSLDLIPDGLEDLGFMDDAFILRGAALAIKEAEPAAVTSDATSVIERLATDAELIREFLDQDYARFSAYVSTLAEKAARGRTVENIVGDETVRGEFAREIQQWASHYTTPTFARDPRNLVKLRSFLGAKLPS